MSDTTSILIVGVGGQGVLLASDVLAAVCLSHGCEVKKSDVHGMAQRGGIVYSHIRFGSTVNSPLIEEGWADALVALEWAEGLRWLPHLKSTAAVIVDAAQIVPPAACRDRRTWASRYPGQDLSALRGDGRDVYVMDARTLAKAAGVAKAANVVLLGVLSTRLEFPVQGWEDAIRRYAPAGFADANLTAFAAGRNVQPLRELPRASLAIPARRDRAVFEIRVIEAWCKGCDICVRMCPEDCLQLDEAGMVRVINAEACTGCRLCELLCPDFAITVSPRGVHSRG